VDSFDCFFREYNQVWYGQERVDKQDLLRTTFGVNIGWKRGYV
jgi:hypothetical protein